MQVFAAKKQSITPNVIRYRVYIGVLLVGSYINHHIGLYVASCFHFSENLSSFLKKKKKNDSV